MLMILFNLFKFSQVIKSKLVEFIMIMALWEYKIHKGGS